MAKISYRAEGGFAAVPGLSTENTLDTDDLPAAEAEALLTLVRTVLERRARQGQPGPPTGSADTQTMFVSVTSEDAVEYLVVTDLDPDPQVRELAEQLRRHQT